MLKSSSYINPVYKYLIICTILLSACESAENEIVKEAENNLILNPNSTGAIRVSEIFSEITYLKLNTPEGVYIGEPNKVLYYNDNIYILDNSRTLNLVAFKNDGDFKYEISSLGRGPGEFMTPNDFDLIPEKNEIVIYDSVNLKVIYFDLHDGSFKYEKSMRVVTKNVASYNNGLVFFNNNLLDGKYNKNVIFTDYDANTYARKINIENRMHGVHFILPTSFTKFNSRIFLTMPFTDVIFEIVDDSVVPYINIDFDNTTLPQDFFNSQNRGDISYTERHKYSHNISSFFESEDILYFNYWYQQGLCRYIEDKNMKSSYHYCDSNIDRDLDYGSYLGWGLGLVHRKLIFYDQPYRLKQYIEKVRNSMSDEEWINYSIQNEHMLNFYVTLKSNDNPYLVIAEVR